MKYTGILIMLLNANLYAQNFTNNWYFGDSAALNFSSGIPEPIEGSQLVSREACCSISDSSGNLMFYSSSYTVWNINNEIMVNGEHLGGSELGNYPSTISNGCVVLQKPLSKNLYYIFISDGQKLIYSIIDMNLNGGDGEVISKNQLLIDTLAGEKIAAAKHANGRDWWIFIHETISSNFIKFLITPYMIEGPYIQSIGKDYNLLLNPIGEMLFSQQGDKLISVTASGIIDLFDFDRCSGELSNWIDLRNIDINEAYGASFSSDGCYIYLSKYNEPSQIYQFNLCRSDIIESRILIFENPFPDYFIGQHQLGPDNKIYIPFSYKMAPSDIYELQNMNLNVINNPDANGLDCLFDTANISLGGHKSLLGLPNFPNYNLGALAGSECDTIIAGINHIDKVPDEINIYPNPASNTINILMPAKYLSESQGDLNITIYNNIGQLVKEIHLNNISEIISFNIDELSSGFYTIRLMQKSSLISSENFSIIK
ncbi:MAG: T9SS type A sorting domain-containing protein [Chitinophagales bacterium]|nr:T9SS type A sorting domain-containing protein [Chitinophagales bacterium]